MGGSESKDKKDNKSSKKNNNNKSGSSDGLIGNRRIRTFLIGGILVAFCALALPYLIDRADLYNNSWRTLKALGWGYSFIATGAAIILVFTIFSMLFHCCNLDGGLESIAGYGLMLGALLYIIGIIIVIFKSNAAGFVGAGFMILIGEGILPGGVALFLALDVIKDFMSVEERRLFYNLLLLAVVSGFCLVGYADYASGLANDSAPALIATGYSIILICSIVYCVLNFCDCITCNCDDNCLVRLLLAGGLIAGGLFCMIGYYTLIGYLQSPFLKNFWSFYLGYTILIGGLCIIWALDMGIVDTVSQKK